MDPLCQCVLSTSVALTLDTDFWGDFHAIDFASLDTLTLDTLTFDIQTFDADFWVDFEEIHAIDFASIGTLTFDADLDFEL